MWLDRASRDEWKNWWASASCSSARLRSVMSSKDVTTPVMSPRASLSAQKLTMTGRRAVGALDEYLYISALISRAQHFNHRALLMRQMRAIREP